MLPRTIFLLILGAGTLTAAVDEGAVDTAVRAALDCSEYPVLEHLPPGVAR